MSTGKNYTNAHHRHTEPTLLKYVYSANILVCCSNVQIYAKRTSKTYLAKLKLFDVTTERN